MRCIVSCLCVVPRSLRCLWTRVKVRECEGKFSQLCLCGSPFLRLLGCACVCVDSTHLPALVLVLVLVPVLVLVLVLELELELELVEPVLVLALAMVEPVLYPSHLSRNWSRWLTEMCPAAPSISCGASTKVRELALGPWTTQLLPSSSKQAMMQVAVPPLQTAARTLPSQSGLPLQAPFCLVSSVTVGATVAHRRVVSAQASRPFIRPLGRPSCPAQQYIFLH